MRNRGLLLAVVCTLALGMLAVPASSQTVTAGIDVWTTPGDGSAYVDFTDNPLPAGFFCSTSQPFSQRIALQGSPVATTPSGVLGSTDTVVERVDDVDLSNGAGSTKIRVLAISFVNRSPISVPGCSDTFSAKVTLGGQGGGSMTISRSGAAGGTFDSSFSVPGKITFTNNVTGQALATPATETVGLQTTNAPWANSVGAGGIAYPSPVSIDTDGNGIPEYTAAGTTPGFAPGWWNGCNPPCPVKIDHNGPHPTWPLPPPPPPRPCSREIASAVTRFEAERAESLSATDASGSASNLEAGAEEFEGELRSARVESSTIYAGQNLTLVDSATLTSPCLVTTSSSTYLVAPR